MTRFLNLRVAEKKLKSNIPMSTDKNKECHFLFFYFCYLTVCIDNTKGAVVKDGPLMLMYSSGTTNGQVNINMDK